MKTLIFTWCMLLLALPSMSQQISIESKVSMLALGDSYTIGESVELDERWPHQLMSRLRELGVSGDSPEYLATTGWTTRNLLNGIQTKLPAEETYNLVSILIGVNNQYQGIDIAAYEPDLRNIIDLALEIVDQERSRLMILSIPDYAYTPFGGGDGSISLEIDEYNTIKQRVADEYGIAYIDITDISRAGLSNPSLVAKDGLHPSKDQYARWVQAIIPRLKLEKTLSVADQENRSKGAVQLYPNPAGSLLHMNAKLNIEKILIFNAVGRMVLNLDISSLPASIDLSHLETGTYTLCAYLERFSDRYCRTLVINQ